MESRKTANLDVPRLALDRIDHFEGDSPWIPYHSRSSEAEYSHKPALLRDVMIGLAELTETIIAMQDLFFDKALDLSMSLDELLKEANWLHRRLESFLEGMAMIETPPVPQVIFLQ